MQEEEKEERFPQISRGGEDGVWLDLAACTHAHTNMHTHAHPHTHTHESLDGRSVVLKPRFKPRLMMV